MPLQIKDEKYEKITNKFHNRPTEKKQRFRRKELKQARPWTDVAYDGELAKRFRFEN